MAVALLSACGPTKIGVVKAPDFNERIAGATLVLKSTKVVDAPAGALGAKADKALAEFTKVAQAGLPKLASGDGFAPKLVTVADPDFTRDGYRKVAGLAGSTPPRHFLIVQPHRMQTRCTATCRSTITVVTSVFDTKLDKEVWQMSADIPEKSGLHQYDNADLEAYWLLVVGQLKENGLL
ncbi:hypothetical protein [Magnetospirillum sp. LM-5]|uniref:hypothetical protein n=1 Tax=Magnetospirillum sp. LM-5 TaxID=2681466 RepID=UPI00156F0EDB|nr:hypothetical protein [Magnetospirillum sp. LM-5]